MTPRRLLAALVLAGAALVLAAPAASAHPMGNFTTNAYSGLVVETDQVRIDYVLDLAEVPALQAMPDVDVDGDDRVDGTESDAFVDRRCAEIGGDLDVMAGGRRAGLAVEGGSLSFPPGNAGLETLRLECRLVAGTGPLGDGTDIAYRDGYETDRVGWREVTAVGDRTTLTASDVPERSVSDRLTSYPDDRAPLRVESAGLTAEPGGPALDSGSGDGDGATDEPAARGADRFTRAFTDLVDDREITPLFALGAVLLATLLGSMHAVAPGHGKTLMAAYVVGRRGTLRHLATIGLTVAATHTVGVLTLGLVVSTSSAFAPERFLLWMEVASGALLAAVGIALLLRGRTAMAAVAPQDHDHPHDHDHHHDDHPHHHDDHDHEPAPERELVLAGAGGPPVTQVETFLRTTAPETGVPARKNEVAEPVPHRHGLFGTTHTHVVPPSGTDRSWRSVVAMGFAGGLVPSPSALVVLLGATALGRVWFGVALVVAYGIGMATTLVAAGLLLLKASDRVQRWALEGSWRGTAMRALPALTAVLLVGGGLLLAGRALLRF